MEKKNLNVQEMAECATAMSKKLVRVYKINDTYSMECENVIKEGREFTNIFLCNRTRKVFCVCVYGAFTNTEEKESELVKKIFDKRIKYFEDDLIVLDAYYNGRMHLDEEEIA